MIIGGSSAARASGLTPNSSKLRAAVMETNLAVLRITFSCAVVL